MLSTLFWKQTIERMAKSAAQAVLIIWGTTQINVLQINSWSTALSVALTAAVVSLFTSIASTPFGESNSPSLVSLSRPQHEKVN